MTDSMKFGPEWLRNVTQETTTSTPTMSGPKYQLAEFRYGREEMLALFDQTTAAPEPLKSLSGLYVDKIQSPLALISVTDEETRMWNRGINSDAVLRANRGPGGPVLGGTGPGVGSMNLGGGVLRGGRGGSSIDRGRGRNLRGSSFHYPSHRTSYDEYNDLLPSFVRNSRPFERTQSQGAERNWLDRNGTADQRSMDRGGNGGGGGLETQNTDWTGGLGAVHHSQLSSSPRKEFPSRSGLADSNNWRKHRGAGESSESEGWRSTSNNGPTSEYNRGNTSGNEKWERNSWRETSDRDREREKEVDTKDMGGKWERRPWENHEKRVRRMTWDSTEDSLPEWATENPSESGGSFDASGAFYRDDVYSDDEEPPRGKENHLRQSEEPYSKTNRPRNRRLSSSEDEKQNYLDESPEKNKSIKKSDDSPLSNSSNKQSLEHLNDNQSSDHSSVSFNRSNSKPEAPSPKKSQQMQNSSHAVYNSNNIINVSNSNSSLPLKQSQSASNLSAAPLASAMTASLGQNSASSRNTNSANHSSASAGINSNDINHSKALASQQFENKMNLSKSDSTSKVPNAAIHSGLLHNSSAPSLTCYGGLADRYQNQGLEMPLPSLSSQSVLFNSKDSRQQPKADETFARMQEVADDIVAKLMTDDEDVPPAVQSAPPAPKPVITNRWYYRDPQGARQGPFSSTEMAEWFKSGYFQVNLLVRRECDESYAPLGDLIKLWGRVPFLADNLHGPFKSSVDAMGIPTIPSLKTAPVAQSPMINCVKPPETPQYSANLPVQQMEDEYQYQYRQLLLRQQAVAFQNVLSKLSQTERWNTLTTLQQQELIMQHMNNSDVPVMPPMHSSGFVVPPEPIQQPPPQPQQQQQQPNIPPNNPLMALLAQMGLPVSHEPPPQISPIQQPPQPPQPPQPQSLHHHHPQPSSMDPWQQFIQKLNGNNVGGFSSHHIPAPIQQPPPQPPQPQHQPLSNSLHTPSSNLLSGMPEDVSQNEVDPVQRLLRQLGIQHQVPGSQQHSANKVDSLWGSLNSNLGSTQASSWIPSQPVNNQSSSIWGEVHPKVMKTEQEIIKEQLKAEETKKLEKLRKQQEKQKKQEEEANKKATEEKKKKSEEKKKEEPKTKEKKKQEEDKKKKLEDLESKKKEDDRKRKDEEKKKKEDDKKKKEEDKKKKDDKEKKKKLQDEDKDKKRQDDDKKKKDTESKRKDDELKEANKRVDQDKNYSENMRSSQDQKSPGPVKQPWSSPTIPTPSLADIQKIEREKKIKQQIKEQQQLAEMAAARNANPEPPQTGFQLKWAETKKAPTVVKSLAEIQAEEQKQLAKQLERERAERLQQAKEVQIPASSCIWANQNLTWNTNQHNSVWGSNSATSNSSGFWDNIANNTNSAKPTANAMTNAKTAAVNLVSKPQQKTTSNVSSSNSVVNSSSSNALNNTKSIVNTNNNTNAKATKGNKQKDANPSPKTAPARPVKNDEFSQWCGKAISNLKTSVDVPTFVGFLRDIESPDEVKDYCKAYLGESKEAAEFARQFIERRSKWRAKTSSKNPAPPDDISAPAPALPAEFTEVKGKNKKTKKKPVKVDNRILGFNSTAQSRINVGDYGTEL